MNIQISNLDTTISDQQLRDLFAGLGEVKSAEVVTDVFTGQSRGFGLVEMAEDEDAKKAIETLNNSKFQNSVILVSEAKPKEVHKGSYKVGSGALNVYRFRKN